MAQPLAYDLSAILKLLSKQGFFMSKDDKTLPPAPKHEGVDPLTDGHTYYSEDVKGASNFHDTPQDVDAAQEDQAEQADVVQAQEERAADPAGTKE